MSVKVKDEGKEELQKMLKEFDRFMNATIEIGIIGDSGEYKTSGGKRITVLEVGRIHEFGGGHVPERSFIRAGFEEYKGDLVREVEKMLNAIVDGKVGADMAADYIGMWMKDKIVKYLTDLSSPPLAPSTIKQKGSSNPLIDTGQLRDSITYKVVM